MRRAMQTVGWGLYLASSWTWCIGMFLPILLLRWWGWPGFLAFAVPNVLGCALFGYVLTPQASRAFVLRFGPWIALFGAATIAYQIGFLLAAGLAVFLLGAVPATIALLASRRAGTRKLDAVMMLIGALAWITSAALFTQFGTGALTTLPGHGSLPATSLPWAAPFIAFGFLLCPYLDPTFHVALQRSPSRHAFLVFGIAFAAMLLFTASFHDPESGNPTADGETLGGRSIIHWQWGVQAAFTTIAVAAAMRSLLTDDERTGRIPTLPGCVVGALLILWGMWRFESWLPPMATALLPPTGPVVGEPTYLRWLGLYGVVFPAAVLLGLRGTPPWLRIAATLIALFLAEMGMVWGRFPLLTAALTVVVVASLRSSRPRMETAEIAPADSR
jgi:hypothetical protein